MPPIDMEAPAMPGEPGGMETPVMPGGASDAGQFSNDTFNLPGTETTDPSSAEPVQGDDPGAFKIPWM